MVSTTSEPGHDRRREVLDDAVLPVQGRVEHDLGQPLLLERAHTLHDLFGRAGEADRLRRVSRAARASTAQQLDRIIWLSVTQQWVKPRFSACVM